MVTAPLNQCQSNCLHNPTVGDLTGSSQLIFAFRFSEPAHDHAQHNRITMKLRSLQLLSTHIMADPLYFSLWFPEVSGPEMLPHALAVLQQFPFSTQRPGITYIAVHPVSWNEATVLEQRFSPGIAPEQALTIAADLVHDDYAYTFDAYWDLWTPSESPNQWQLIAAPVKFIIQGEEFDDGTFQQTGHIQVDLGIDSLFLQETVALTEETQAKVRDNVAKLVEFTLKLEKNTRASARLLWSESEENLAQKLIARLQKVQ
jgi:hypothetical protein